MEHRYPNIGPLAELAWTWRGDLTFYDGLYVALAVRLGAPVVTVDAKLLGTPGLACEIDLV